MFKFLNGHLYENYGLGDIVKVLESEQYKLTKINQYKAK